MDQGSRMATADIENEIKSSDTHYNQTVIVAGGNNCSSQTVPDTQDYRSMIEVAKQKGKIVNTTNIPHTPSLQHMQQLLR